MDFEAILSPLIAFFRKERCNFAIVGAFSLHAYGLSRSTGDLDFITELRRQDDLIQFLETLGYETVYRSPGYSSHEIPVPRPEHINAMKVLAMKNDPSRTFQEMADIQFLMSLPEIEDSLVKEFFEKQGMLNKYCEIKEKQKFN